MGIPVYLPFGDNEKSDMIADFNGKLNKIQVKTSVDAKNGNMVFSLVSSYSHRGKGENYKYSSDDIDYFVLYNIKWDKLFLVSIDEAPKTAITIRYEKSKNNQSLNIKYEKDYLMENVLCVETLHETPKL